MPVTMHPGCTVLCGRAAQPEQVAAFHQKRPLPVWESGLFDAVKWGGDQRTTITGRVLISPGEII